MTVPRLDHAQWLREGALARLLAVLDGDGEEARVVGGAVRNALLGEPIGEFDIATTALPAEVIRRANAQGFKTVPTGIDHGTVTVVVDGRPFEVTTLREDVETFGRKARVAFGRDWKMDADRRDFTINALSVSRDGTIHDYVGGLADLQKHRIRFIGDPAARIAEDYLRILRFFRFQAHYGEGLPDREGLAACIAARAGLATLSRERVRAELLKLLLGRHAVPVLAVMSECGLLISVLGGVPLLASVSNLAKLEQAIGLHPDAVRRLGALAVFVPEDAQRLAERLRLANVELERLASMGERWRGSRRTVGEKRARAALPARPRPVRRPRPDCVVALAGRHHRPGLARAAANCRNTGSSRCSRSRPRTSCSAGSRKAPRSGPRLRRRKSRGSRRISRRTRTRSRRSRRAPSRPPSRAKDATPSHKQKPRARGPGVLLSI